MTGPQDAYDSPLSALRDNVENLGAWLAIWEARSEPDAHARRCANDAVDAIDTMLRDLYTIRARLITQIRVSDDASAARIDKLLAGSDAMTSSSDQASPEPTGLGETEGPAL